MKNFINYSKYYDLLYQDKDYELEVEFVFDKLKEIDPNIRDILELGSGSGNHAAIFTEKYPVNIHGIELSESMYLQSTKKQIKNFYPHCGNIKEFQLNNKFDAAISLFHVISYLTDDTSIISCLKCVNSHLKKNGLFLFDVWFTPAVYSQKPITKIKRLENEELKITRITESDVDYINNIVKVNFEIIIEDKITKTYETLFETHPMRHFSVNEIKLLCELTGFEIISKGAFLSDKVLSDETWGVYYLIRKI